MNSTLHSVKRTRAALSILFLVSFFGLQLDLLAQVTSGNPIIKHIRSADPSAQVWNDGKVWIYASHDQDDATEYSTMDGYHVFSSYDMVSWTDHGEILHSRDVSWGNPNGGFMFAPDAAYKDGTYYLYFPTMSNEWKWRVGVATSDRPEGPFKDVGHFIDGTDHIDPTCFTDDDGQAYLIWGGDGKGPWIARLKENMTELAEVPRKIEYGSDNFGEGPYMHKHNGIYYFSYTCHTCYPYQGYYAMGDNPYGPFEYKGELNLSPPGAQDHHSIIEYHGQWYYFYHLGNYGSDGSLYRRNVCVDSLFYNEDGSMQEIVQTQTGVGQDSIGMTQGHLVPGRFQAEDYFRQESVATRPDGTTDTLVTDIQDGDYIDFVLEVLGDETFRAEIKVLNPLPGTAIYLLVDEVLKDTLPVDGSTEILSTDLFLYHGKHTLKLLFSHPGADSDLIEVDWIDLDGDIIYHLITASATSGGSILPEGAAYVAEGDSVKFSFEPFSGQKLDSLVVDGITLPASNSYTFREVNQEHSIEVFFSACEGSLLVPYAKINEEDYINSSTVSVNEGEDLKLKVEFQGNGELTWYHPGGKTNGVSEIEITGIRVAQAGTYSVYFLNSEGCESKLKFEVTVLPIVLDVYQAEDWIEQSGVQTEACTDLGGGEHVAIIENGDWCSYSIEIEKAGIYDFTTRVATAFYGGYIEMTIGEEKLAMVLVRDDLSNGWQDWYTSDPVEVELEAGTHDIKLTFTGSVSYLFNLNWFDLVFNRDFPVGSNDDRTAEASLLCYYPDNGDTGIDIAYTLNEDSPVSMVVINMLGMHARSLVHLRQQSPGNYRLHWDGKSDQGSYLPGGMYLLVFSIGQDRLARPLILPRLP